MIRLIAALLAAGTLATAGGQVAAPLSLAVAGTPPPAVRRGIEFGIAELSQTARLLGYEATLVRLRETSAQLDGVVAADGVPVTNTKAPVVYLGGLPPDPTRCDFSVAPLPGEERNLAVWHPSLDRFGASELNDRFSRRYEAPLTADAWLGWIAVKALGEAALRRNGEEDRCEALSRLRFDGHKGRPLYFDPATRVLSQPLYVVRDGRVVEEVK